MALTGFAAPNADQIYQSGPESLAAESWAIVAGPITHYSKQITSASEGAEPIPLTWTVSGQLAQPIQLKGTVPSHPLVFSREERSPLVPQDPSVPAWQLSYGELAPGDSTVLFFQGDRTKPVITVLPSGADSGDLIALLQAILPIQAIKDPAQQTTTWLQYLEEPHSQDEGRKAALRSLIKAKVAWPKLAAALGRNSSPDIRTFVFGIVAYAVMRERFGADQPQAVDFLCREFAVEQNPRIALQYVLTLKLLLRYTAQEEGKHDRLPLEQRIVDALKQRRSMAPLTPELAEQYKQIQAAYPGIL
jgi:hypothetical protein